MTGSILLGTAGVLIASLFWGSNASVCRKYDLPSDGMHFVLLMSTGILFIGILTLFATSPLEDGDYEVVFSPEGLLGGIIWAAGNFLTVPIIRNAGLGVGFATWSGVNLVVAFLVGMVGFGAILPGEALDRPTFGAVGIGLAIVALISFANVTTTTREEEECGGEDDVEVLPIGVNLDEPLLNETNTNDDDVNNNESASTKLEEAAPGDDNIGEHESVATRTTTSTNRPIGIAMAAIAGILYGFQFVPLSVWHNKVEKTGHIFDQDIPSELTLATRFFFSQFAGAFLASFLAFTLYCIWMRNMPSLVPPEATLPCILSGMVWAIGCAGGMLATSSLGNAVGFPLLINGAFLVNSSWSILYFKEIRGSRNLRLFFGAFILNMLSSVFISLSKG